jgi:hypothetical protein
LPPIVRPRQSDEARKKFIEITKLLEMDTLVFFGNCGDFTLPAIPKGRFRAAQDEIQLAAHFGNPDELATQWQGKVLPLPFAKEVCQPGSIDQLKKER